MITGFNPADMYAADHIRRVLTDLPGRLLRDRRVHHPQGVRLLEGRRRRREPHRSGARPDPRFRRRGRPGGDPPQRHRHAVPEAGPGALRAQADGRALPPASEDHDHLGALRPRPHRATARGPGRAARASARRPAARRTSTSTSPGTRSPSTSLATPETIARHRGADQSLSRPLPLRHRRGRAEGAGEVPRRSTTCTRRCSPSSLPRRARSCARATTSDCSTRPGGACAPGKRQNVRLSNSARAEDGANRHETEPISSSKERGESVALLRARLRCAAVARRFGVQHRFIQGHVTGGGGALSEASVTATASRPGSRCRSGRCGWRLFDRLPGAGLYEVTAALCAYSAAVTKTWRCRWPVGHGRFRTRLRGRGPRPKPTMGIYGFAMLDMGYQGGQNDPDWFDVLRPTKLPAFENEFGEDGHWFAGVRQSRLGVKANMPTAAGEIKTTFEFELFGTGVDAGQTTFRLRHAYGELGSSAPARPGARSWTSTCSRTRSSTGDPNGMVVLPQRAGALDADPGRLALDLRARAPGRARRPAAIYADRIELAERQGALPVSRPLRPSGATPATGATSRSRASCATCEWDDTARRRVRPRAAAHRLGHQPELEHQARRARRCGCSASTAKASRTT